MLSLLERERLARPAESDESRVRAIAARMIKEAGIDEPPVNVALVASLLDIGDIIHASELDVPGCLLPGLKGSTILVRAEDPETRQRFTIYHECGHTFFPGFRLATQFRCTPVLVGQAGRTVEQLCDAAASELLLPRRLLGPRAEDAGFSLRSVRDLAAEFQASLVATAIAVTMCSAQHSAVLTFEVMQKPTEYGTLAAPKLRLKSAMHSGPWPFFRRHKSASRNDPFDRANQGESVVETGLVLRGIVATPTMVDLCAEPAPYFDGNDHHQRVIAILRHSGHGATGRG
jgi:Zn-dependent peptidase ImmA (M78 family)